MESEIKVGDKVLYDGKPCTVFLTMGGNAIITGSDGTQYLAALASLKKE